LKYSTTFNFLL